jgi:hypothetical protein
MDAVRLVPLDLKRQVQPDNAKSRDKARLKAVIFTTHMA